MRNKILQLTLSLGLLAGAMALFQFTNLDLRVQDHIYDFANHRWPLDKQDTLPRILFYTGPKIALGIMAGVVLVWLLLPTRWRPAALRQRELPWPNRRLWFLLLCVAVIPATIGFMKSRSDLYCPWSIDRYGGDRPHLHFFDPLPPGYPPDCGECFPAGHASGGFALLGLYYLTDSRRGRRLGFTLGMTAGWVMGIYQMLKGAHFLSHTIVTMLISWAIIQFLVCLFNLPTRNNHKSGPSMATTPSTGSTA
jgi:membrane-associated PAP2 superfamily phosphatase